jgi:hypothetical protein
VTSPARVTTCDRPRSTVVRFEDSVSGPRARMFPISERDRTTASLLTTVRLTACDYFRGDHQGVIARHGSRCERSASVRSRAGSASRIPLAISAWSLAHQPLERLPEGRARSHNQRSEQFHEAWHLWFAELDSLAETLAPCGVAPTSALNRAAKAERDKFASPASVPTVQECSGCR